MKSPKSLEILKKLRRNKKALRLTKEFNKCEDNLIILNQEIKAYDRLEKEVYLR